MLMSRVIFCTAARAAALRSRLPPALVSSGLPAASKLTLKMLAAVTALAPAASTRLSLRAPASTTSPRRRPITRRLPATPVSRLPLRVALTRTTTLPARPGKRARRKRLTPSTEIAGLTERLAAAELPPVGVKMRDTYTRLPPFSKNRRTAWASWLVVGTPPSSRSSPSPNRRWNSSKPVTRDGRPAMGPKRVWPTKPAVEVATPSMDLARKLVSST